MRTINRRSVKYSPNHPTMRGREIPATLAERRAAVRERMGIPERRDHYKVKAWLGFVTLVLSAGLVEEKPVWALALMPVIAWLWISGINDQNRGE